MTSFGWWQGKANDQGLVMCMLCFDTFTLDQMYKDDEGNYWDACLDCQEKEDAHVRANSK